MIDNTANVGKYAAKTPNVTNERRSKEIKNSQRKKKFCVLLQKKFIIKSKIKVDL